MSKRMCYIIPNKYDIQYLARIETSAKDKFYFFPSATSTSDFFRKNNFQIFKYFVSSS